MAQPPTPLQTTPWTGKSPARVTCPKRQAGVSTSDSVTRQSDTVTCEPVRDSENTPEGGRARTAVAWPRVVVRGCNSSFFKQM